MGNILFTNVRIFDGTGEHPYLGEVLVQGNRIKHVGRGSRTVPANGHTVIDGAGATLMPGMTEAHAHFSWNNRRAWKRSSACRRRSTRCSPRPMARDLSRHGIHLLRRRRGGQAAPRRASSATPSTAARSRGRAISPTARRSAPWAASAIPTRRMSTCARCPSAGSSRGRRRCARPCACSSNTAST